MLVLAALVAIPQWLISLAMSTVMPMPDATDPFAALSGSVLAVIPGFLVLIAWLGVGFGAMVQLGAVAYLGQPADDAFGALRRGVRFTRPLFVANLFGYLRAVVVTLLVTFVLTIPTSMMASRVVGAGQSILGGVIVAAMVVVILMIFCAELGRVLLATPAVMLEDAGGLRALKRGRTLTASYVARAAALIFITVVIAAVISFGAVFVATTLVPSAAVASAMASLLMLPLSPVIACVTVVLYYDLRIRKEGFDIDLLVGTPATVPVA